MAMMVGRKTLMTALLALTLGLAACGDDAPPPRPDPGPFIENMIRKLSDPDYTVRRCAARALGRLGPCAILALPSLECAAGDEEESVRIAAEFALSRIAPAARLLARSLEQEADRGTP